MAMFKLAATSDNKHFEFLSPEKDAIALLAKNLVLEEENILRVHGFRCSPNGEFIPDHPDASDMALAKRKNAFIRSKMGE